MQQLRFLPRRWRGLSLAIQFFIAGGAVLFVATMVLGLWVTAQIKDGVTRNSAATTALYIDSVIAPLLPDLRKNGELSYSVKRALDETLGRGGLGRRVVSFNLWTRNGTILYAKNKSLIGQRFEPSANLVTAFGGNVVANLVPIDGPHPEDAEAAVLPLLEIYNPVREPWSGRVVAVSEFYESAEEFERTLSSALRSSWMVVLGTTMVSLLILSGIVFRGSRLIDNQRERLTAQVTELEQLLNQNKSLRFHVQRASRRVTALNERYLRRIGADLHDGPAQLLALASLRMDSQALFDSNVPKAKREREIETIRRSLSDAMREIRDICTGLVLPQIETTDLNDILRLATSEHQQRTKTNVRVELPGDLADLGPSEKICVYRLVQEGLNNAYMHGKAKKQTVKASVAKDQLSVEVSDAGPGFDVANVPPDRLGLAGLRERVESIGGHFQIRSSPHGTQLSINLSIGERP